MSQNILTVGSLAFDTIETPHGKRDQALGGSANYFSIAASLFNPVSIIAVVGDDFPQKHLDWLNTRGVNTSGILKAHGKTFHWTGEYGINMNEAITKATDLNVFADFKPKLESHHATCPYVFLANIDPELQLDVLKQVKSPKLIAMDTMNLWIKIKLDALKGVLSKVDLLSINDQEAYLLTGETNFSRAAQKIKQLGPSVVLIKRGEYGASMFTHDEVFLLPAFPTQDVKDPTGAGDTFAGGLIGYLARQGVTREMLKSSSDEHKKTLRKAVVAGSVLASFTVEDFSIDRLAAISEKDLLERERHFSGMLFHH